MRLITLFGNATNATNAKCQLNYFHLNVVSIQKSCIFTLRNKQRNRAMKTKNETIEFINKKIKEGFSGRELLDLTNKFRNGDFDEPNVPSDLLITKDKNGFPTIELR